MDNRAAEYLRDRRDDEQDAFVAACEAVTESEIIDRIVLEVQDDPARFAEMLVTIASAAFAIDALCTAGVVVDTLNSRRFGRGSRQNAIDVAGWHALVTLARDCVSDHDKTVSELGRERLA
jgi:hypothetical protein